MPDLIAEIPKATSIVAEEYAEKVLVRQMSAHDAIIASRISQATQANKKRKEAPEYKIGEEAWLATKNLKLAENRMRKLAPKYIGPMKITSVSNDGLTVGLALGPELEKRRVFPKFHVDLLKPYIKAEDDRWPNRSIDTPNAAFRLDVDSFLIDEVVDHRTAQKNGYSRLQFLVTWASGEDDSWVEQNTVQDTQQVAEYLKEKKVSSFEDLITIRGGKGARARRALDKKGANVSTVTIDYDMDRRPDDENQTREALESLGTVLTIARNTAGFDEESRRIVNRALGGNFADCIMRTQRRQTMPTEEYRPRRDRQDNNQYRHDERRLRSRSPTHRSYEYRTDRNYERDQYQSEVPRHRPDTPRSYDRRTPRLPDTDRYNRATDYEEYRRHADTPHTSRSYQPYRIDTPRIPTQRTYPAWSPPTKIRFCRNCGAFDHLIRKCRQRDNPRNKEESKEWEIECDNRQRRNWQQVKAQRVEPWTLDWSTPPLPEFVRRRNNNRRDEQDGDAIMRETTPPALNPIQQPIARPVENTSIIDRLDALSIAAASKPIDKQGEARQPQEIIMIALPRDISRFEDYVDEANRESIPVNVTCEIKMKSSVVNANLTLLEAYMSAYTSIRSLLAMASASSDEERMDAMTKKMSKVEKWFVQVRDIVTTRSASEDVEENLRQYDRMMLASLRFIYDFAEDGMEKNMQKVENQFKTVDGLDQVTLPEIPKPTITMEGYEEKHDEKENIVTQSEWTLKQCNHPRIQEIATILGEPMKNMERDTTYQVGNIIRYAKMNIMGRPDLWYEKDT